MCGDSEQPNLGAPYLRCWVTMSDYRLNELNGIIDEHRARKIRETTVKKKREATAQICPHSAQSNATSTLNIHRIDSDTIQLDGEISNIDGCAHHHRALQPASRKIPDLDQRWVEEHALTFIKQVLDVNRGNRPPSCSYW